MDKVTFSNVSLSLPAPTHIAWSLKAHFIEWAKHPGLLLNPTPKHQILKNLSFSAKAGERIGIIGRNGSGKTSLCRLISSQLLPSSGSVQVAGSVTPVFNASAGIYPDLTGRENARLLLHYLLPHNTHEHEQLLNDAFEFSGLNEWVDRPFRLYSTGMKARLSLSLITTLQSEILILDEVFDGADEEFRSRMRGRIQKLIDRSQLFFFVSHSREQVLAVCDRLIILDRGVLVYDGDTTGAYQLYDSLMGEATV